MERLTKRISENIIELSARANPIQYNGSAQRVHIKHPFWNVFNKLCDYEEAEDQGLLLRLPCPIGTTVYFVEKRCNADSAACYGGCEKCADYSISSTTFDFDMISHVGNFYFLTKEEAERALARMEGENV